MRLTIRFNEVEKASLELFKKQYQIEKDSEAIKLALQFASQYLKIVSETFFPSNFDVVLMRKRKSFKSERKVF